MWIGLDMGGTKVRGILSDDGGTILKRTEAPTQASGQQALLATARVLEELYHPQVQGIGLGCPGRVDVQAGKLSFGGNNLPGLAQIELRQEIETIWSGLVGGDAVLSDRFTVAIDNDGNLAALGETWLGAGQGSASMVMITLGTGVGAGIIQQGRIWHGHHYNGGEWGHSLFMAGGRPCSCGLNGCVEQYLSGTALAEEYTAIEEGRSPHFPALPAPEGAHPFFQAARDGKKEACILVKEFGERLAWAFRGLQNILDPEIIVLGGGLIDTADLWWDDVVSLIYSYPFPCRIEKARLGDLAGNLGAVRLVRSYCTSGSGLEFFG